MTANGQPEPPRYKDAREAARIYFLPNLFTAGNLFFGFVAMIRCIQARYVDAGAVADPERFANDKYTEAVICILLAAVCDALDGRVARLGGRESLFGKEFDSIADTVSFGVAPALLVFFLILGKPTAGPYEEMFRQIGWFIGFIYLLCVAVRLARFNVLTHPLLPGAPEDAGRKDFMGLPSPAAAGFVASLALVLLHLELRRWAILLPPLLLLVAFLMVSNIAYPSFKALGWQTQMRARTFIGLIVGIALLLLLREYSFAVFFLGYIFYGLGRYLRGVWQRRHAPQSAEATAPADDEDPTF